MLTLDLIIRLPAAAISAVAPAAGMALVRVITPITI